MSDVTNNISTINFNDYKIIHIRIKQRKAKSYITSIDNLQGNLDIVLKRLKKVLCCNGTINSDEIINLNGDHRETIKNMLLEAQICREDQIIIHGI